MIGRKTRGRKRELVIGQGSHGCVALYQFVPTPDIVFVLVLRSQRGSGFKLPPSATTVRWTNWPNLTSLDIQVRQPM
jgi:hypothetical protein